MSQRLTLAVAVVLTFSVVGCGWHLRGAGSENLVGLPVFLDARMGQGALARETAAVLLNLDADLVDTRAAAQRVLVLLDESVRRRTLSKDERGRAREYELDYQLQYRVEGPEPGDVLLSRQTVVTTRSYDVDPLDTLANEAQAERLTEELRSEAVRLMLARVARAEGNRNP